VATRLQGFRFSAGGSLKIVAYPFFCGDRRLGLLQLRATMEFKTLENVQL
jgi:hypothetical protein